MADERTSDPRTRPILFSGPMVRAILEGRKTQTRRALKHQPIDIIPMPRDPGEWVTLERREPEPKGRLCRCRFGVPGDLLWVRETWSRAKLTGSSALFYRADGDTNGRQVALSYIEREERWRPSIHMPRGASRLTLRITGVRVERLQEISDADAIAEGCPAVSLHALDCASTPPSSHYRNVWEDINGKGSWQRNPWVWVLEFERLANDSRAAA